MQTRMVSALRHNLPLSWQEDTIRGIIDIYLPVLEDLARWIGSPIASSNDMVRSIT